MNPTDVSVKKVLIVDDDLLFADSLRLLLLDEGISEVGLAQTTEEALRAVEQGHWDVVLIELQLSGRSTLPCGLDIRNRCPGARVIVLTRDTKPDWIRAVSRSGLDGFLTKDVTPLHLLRTIRNIRAGRAKPLARDSYRRPTGYDGMMRSLLQEQLTKREKQVLGLLVDGHDGLQISRMLHVAPNTVRTHVQNVLVKLQVHSRLEAAAFAVKHGLVEDVSPARAS